MIIRFQCPSCRQPLEIDEQWAGQSVACPYCKRVVSAPTSSTWHDQTEIPSARPAVPGFAPPPPPVGGVPAAPVRRGNFAVWAITLAIIGLGLTVFGMGIWGRALEKQVTEQLGSNPTPEQVQEAVQEIVMKRQLRRSPRMIGAVVTGMICSLAALFLAVSAIVRQERGRGKAIVACILSVTLLFCQSALLLVAMTRLTPPGH